MRRFLPVLAALAVALASPAAHSVTPAISADQSHVLALDSAGKVSSWGSDSFGQLGQGRTLYRTTPTRIAGVPAFKHVSAYQHVVAVDNGGQVWTWGQSCNGSLGPRDEPVSSKPGRVIGMTNVVQAEAGLCYTVAVKADGTVWGWGQLPGGVPGGLQPVQIAGIAKAKQVAAATFHVLVLLENGTVMAFGNNSGGALGQGTVSSTNSLPVAVPNLTGVTKVIAKGGYSMALRTIPLTTTQEALWWGGNFGSFYSPFGTPTVLNRTATGYNGTALDVTMGDIYPTVVKNDGTVWRFLRSGPLPTDGTWQQYAGFTGIRKIDSNGPTYFGVDSRGVTFATGVNTSGELGQGNTNDFGTTVVAVTGMSGTSDAILSFGRAAFGLKSDGSLWTWALNALGEAGDGTVIRSSVPRPITLNATIKEIAAGRDYSLALDTLGNVWGWGRNAYNKLGPGGDISTPTLIPNATGVSAIAAGQDFLMVLKTNGTVWVSGQTFVNTVTQDALRQVTGLAGIVKIAAGVNGYAIDGTGKLFTFGLNQGGQSGLGAKGTQTTTPTQIVFPGNVAVLQVSASTSAGGVGAVTSDFKAWGWGNEFGGPVGNGTTTKVYVPTQVTGVVDAAEIRVGNNFTLLRRQNGTLAWWGNSTLSTTSVLTPAAIPFHDPAAAIASEGLLGFVMGTKGAIWGFGQAFSESVGTVGDGAFVVRRSPVAVFAPNGNGTLDANNWFLDLDPAQADVVPAALVPGAIAVARAFGTTEGLGLDATVRYKGGDLGKRVNHYVVAAVPPTFFSQVKSAPGLASPAALKSRAAKAGGFVLAQLTPQGWVDVNGQLIAYSTGVANAGGGAANILNGINAALLAGSRFCVGYGESAQSMLSESALREVLLLEGAAAVVSGVPCVLSGVYVDGPPSSLQGTPVTFNASVVGLSPTGTVQFMDGFGAVTAPLAIVPANAAVSNASFTTNTLAVGSHSIGASYSGDAQNPVATTEFPRLHAVLAPQATPSLAITGPASSLVGEEVALTLVIAGNQPTGTVQFKDNAVNLGAAVPLVAGVAVLRTTALATGPHAITAAYSGDVNNVAGTSPTLNHVVVNTLATTVTLATSTTTPAIGTPVTLTATVTGASPTGTVSFEAGTANFSGPVALVAGQAQFTTNAFAPGTHFLTAVYSGDANNPPLTSDTLVLEVPLAVDPAQANLDTDGDGLTNAVEQAEKRNPFIKDNDIFGNARLFAMQQYRDFLAREGDAGGIAFWANQVTSGAQTRGMAIESFFNSPEFQGTISPVARLYFAYFLRIPDYPGLNFWIGYYRAGNPLVSISQAFATSPEFTTTYGSLSNGQFVDLVYQNVLGRAPDAGGRAFWTGQLDSAAMNRGEVMLGFSESDEYKLAISSEIFVTMIYNGMLRRAPDASGFSFWVQYKDAGNPGLALIDLFLGSAEYRARFLP